MILESLITDEKKVELENDISDIKNEIKELESEIKIYSDLRKEMKEKKKLEYIDDSKLQKDIKIYTTNRFYQDEIKRFDKLLAIEESRLSDIEKYTDRRGFVLTKDERKDKTYLQNRLQKYFELNKQIDNILKENNKIRSINDNINKEVGQLTRKLIENNKKYESDKLELSTKNNKLQRLLSFYNNQLILKTFIPYITEKNININDDDDYEDIRDKCILHYSDSLIYTGNMKPLCLNSECTGIKIGYSCNCGQNNNIWFTVKKPDNHTKYIIIKDDIFLPELERPLGYLIDRNVSIEYYKEYSKDNDIIYDNYYNLFIKANINHNEFLMSSYCVPCDEYPKHQYYDEDNECDEDCFFQISSESFYCDCGQRQLVWEEEEFNPEKSSIFETRPNGYLRNEY